MPEFAEYRAIRFQGIVSLVGVHPSDSTRLHWGGGLAYMAGAIGVETLKTYFIANYQKADMERYEAEDDIEIQFFRDFHVVQPEPVRQSAAWLSPDGTFYPCLDAEHESLAKCLSVQFYGELRASRELEEQGWLRIYGTGISNSLEPFVPTQSQLDTMADLVQVSTGRFQHFIASKLTLLTQAS